MPKLPAVKPRVVIQFLERNGFALDHVSGSHLIFYHPVSRRRAVVPRHNRDMPRGTLVALLREAWFTRDELVRFLEGE
ncbi:MAG: type II toxin-antitoxin system HicA family toxin [Acidobacteriia bacterium]|nr:type II toxin-antitoxin system HicA family toxin [Terriglobia bacterium]